MRGAAIKTVHYSAIFTVFAAFDVRDGGLISINIKCFELRGRLIKITKRVSGINIFSSGFLFSGDQNIRGDGEEKRSL